MKVEHHDDPRVEAPRTDAPRTDAPRTDDHRTDDHRTDDHRTDAHRTDAHHTDAHHTDTHRTDAPRTDAHRTDAHRTDDHRTDLRTDAHRIDAHLTDAHLTDAHLTDDLRSVDNGNVATDNPRDAHAVRVADDEPRRDRVITLKEVRQRGWIIVGDDVYDIEKFAQKHPGGKEILHLRGGDATFPLINAHGVRGELPKLPKKLRVGTIDRATLRPVDRDLRAMWQDFRARGLFVYKRWWFLLDLVRGLGFFVCGWLVLDTAPALAFFAFLIARLNVMWWVHDVCHDSVFLDRAMARRWAEMVSITFVGTPVLDYQYVVHRIHHGFTNTIGADQAIETGPVVWHQMMRARTSDTFVPIQSWFWFLVVLPLTLPYFVYIGMRHAWRERHWFALAGVVVRWSVLFVAFWGHMVVFLVPSFLAAYLLGLTASLNHFHRPMAETNDWNFARSVTCVTQNLGATNRVSAWLVGGLSFHIEHHFFATMPRRNYRKIAREIRAFCVRNHLPYTSESITWAVVALWRKLRRPYDDNTPPSRPSMDLEAMRRGSTR